MRSRGAGMNDRLRAALSRASGANRRLLMAGLVAADPYLDATLDYMTILADQGADIIELIFPFSDPTYHGAVIQRAEARAIREEITWQEIVDLGQRFRATHQTPVLFSVYYNQVLARGIGAFVEGLIQAEFDGVMVADLPFGEGRALREALAARGLVLPPTIAPTTGQARFAQMAAAADSFMIWTGHAGDAPTISQEQFAQTMREFKTISQVPILASMKVTDAEDAGRIVQHCDGVLVSSALVWLVEGRGAQVGESLAGVVRQLRVGIDATVQGAPRAEE